MYLCGGHHAAHYRWWWVGHKFSLIPNYLFVSNMGGKCHWNCLQTGLLASSRGPFIISSIQQTAGFFDNVTCIFTSLTHMIMLQKSFSKPFNYIVIVFVNSLLRIKTTLISVTCCFFVALQIWSLTELRKTWKVKVKIWGSAYILKTLFCGRKKNTHIKTNMH